MTQNISPDQVLSMLNDVPDALYEALRVGTSYADGLQPDIENQHFWSHSARFGAWRNLCEVTAESWSLRESVPNCGIHLTIAGLHSLRVVRSLSNNVPPPGRNRARRAAWTGINEQLSFELPSGTQGTSAPLLSLLADWNLDEDREPVIFLSLPIQAWNYGNNPRCHWRVPLRSEGSLALEDLAFPGGDDGDPMISINIDPAEWSVGSE
jgi:hypothetical protein